MIPSIDYATLDEQSAVVLDFKDRAVVRGNVRAVFVNCERIKAFRDILDQEEEPESWHVYATV